MTECLRVGEDEGDAVGHVGTHHDVVMAVPVEVVRCYGARLRHLSKGNSLLGLEAASAIADEDARYNRLVELNVIEQCRNVVKTASVQKSFAKNKFPVVHGWVFGFNDGLLKDLEIDFEGILHNIQKIYNLTES